MRHDNFEGLSHFDIANVQVSIWDAQGFLGLQPQTEGSEASSTAPDASPGAGGVSDYEVINPGGVFHRPLAPAQDTTGKIDPTQSGQALVFLDGGRGFALPLGDVRSTSILPTCAPGSTFVYADNGAFIRIEGSGPAVGQISVYTTDDGTPDGYVVGFNVWPTEIRMIPPGGGRHWADVTGFHWIDGGSGGSMNLGYVSGVPGSNAGFDVTADDIQLVSGTILLGNMGPLGRGPVMRGDLFQASFAAPLLAAVQALAAAVAALAVAPAVVGSPPAAVAALVGPIQAAVTALAALCEPVVGPPNVWCSGTTMTS